MSVPSSADVVVIGAGIHGLATAWSLSESLAAKGKPAQKILVIDKTEVGAGASGIACGVIRNNYFQPAMRELMAHSVSVWESDPEAFSYHPVGYMQISPELMHADVATIYEQQKAIGYESTFIEGKAESKRYMQDIFSDWQTQGITSVLHEKKGGYANNMRSLKGLEKKARDGGVQIVTGVEVTGFTSDSSSGAVSAVCTSAGDIQCEQVVVAPGPWVRDFWSMLELPETISVKDLKGTVHDQVPMWRFWQLEEGVLGVDPGYLKDNNGNMPSVIHVDSDAPLHNDVDGSLITDKLWGIYFKPDFCFGGVQGGAAPYKVDKPAKDVSIDPYGPASPEFVASQDFVSMWTSALAHCLKRFEGKSDAYIREPSGGIGCLTPDSFPVFDRFRENVYVIADANHGYKMIGVGKLIAEELQGQEQALLTPFRMSRYQTGKLHPVSNSPFPWS